MNKKKNVRRNIIPGNVSSLWKAVSEAKDKNTEEIPSEMLLNGIKVTTDEIEEVFTEFF